jgi:transposase-like protein
MRQPRPQSAAHVNRLEQLVAAVDAYRGGKDKPRRRLSTELRARVVAVIDAGASVSAVAEACKVSESQITRWRAAARSGEDAAASSVPALVSPRVLSVVDGGTREQPLQDGEIELRIGGWHVSLRRVVE